MPVQIRRWLAPAAVLLTTAAIVATVVAVAQGHREAGRANPPVLVLDEVAAATQAEAGAAGQPGSGAVAAPGGAVAGSSGGFTVTGTFPDGPERAAVHQLSAGPVPRDRVVALAKALGLTAEPVRGEAGWAVVEHGRRLSVIEVPGWPWSLQPAGADGLPRGCVAGAAAGPECPPVVLTPGEATARPVPVPPPGPAPRQGAPGDVPQSAPGDVPQSAPGGSAPSAVATGSAAARPIPLPEPVPIPEPTLLPVPSRPSDADAIAVAKRVQLAAGFGSDGHSQVRRLPGTVAVTTDPVVASLPTSGYGTELVLEPDGRVASGRGWLAATAPGPVYPVVDAHSALARTPVVAIGCPDCPQGRIEITGARFGLALRHDVFGRALLVPAWLYQSRGYPLPLVGIAVDPAYLGKPPVPGPFPSDHGEPGGTAPGSSDGGAAGSPPNGGGPNSGGGPDGGGGSDGAVTTEPPASGPASGGPTR